MTDKNTILPHKKTNIKFNTLDLCQDEVEELKEAFKIYEKDRKINPTEIIKIFENLNYDKNNKSIMNMLNYFTDESITIEQFLEGCDKHLGRHSDETDLRNLFNLFIESEQNVFLCLFTC